MNKAETKREKRETRKTRVPVAACGTGATLNAVRSSAKFELVRVCVCACACVCGVGGGG